MKILCMLLCFFPAFAYALVDMRNANFSDSWTDLTLPGAGYDLKIERTYNSRTLFNGIFGFGWCSDFESRLDVTPEGNLKIVECGGGLEVTYTTKNFKHTEIKKTINKIIKKVKSRNKSLDSAYLKNLKKKLSYDSNLREAFAKQLKIVGKSKKNAVYVADGRANESIRLKGGLYVRSLPNGTYEKYDKKGRLVFMYDKNNQYIKINYKNKRISSVTDNTGRSLQFKYKEGFNKVALVTGPNKLQVTYQYEKEDLVLVVNSWNIKYTYKYDGLHNLVQINFPDKSKKTLTYNEDRDWVLSFTNRKGCIEEYNYRDDKKNPLNHYWSTVKKTCGGQVTNKSSYEFFHKRSVSGKRYLARTRVNNNGKNSDTVYHEIFGKPIFLKINGISVRYKYYQNGLMKIKEEKRKLSKFYYKNSCMKVSRVEAHYFNLLLGGSGRKAASRKKKTRQMVSTDFIYDEIKCNLAKAENSLGQSATLSYDYRGRIASIKDQAKKIVFIEYDERFGKPSLIRRPGLGSLHVKYKADGSVGKVKSGDGVRVATQVANVFNTLLEIIAPATGELTI